MPVDASDGKSQGEVDKIEMRDNAFFTQTIVENNARLDTKNSFADLLDEIKFIESKLLTSGPSA